MIKYRLIAIACCLVAIVLYSSSAPRPFGAILFAIGVCFEFAAWRTWKKGAAAKRSA